MQEFCAKGSSVKIPIENTLQIRRTGVYCKQPLMKMMVGDGTIQ